MVSLANPSSSNEPQEAFNKNEVSTIDTISNHSSSSSSEENDCNQGTVVLQEEGNDVMPTFGNISVTDSSDIHFGPKTIYQAPVTIKQFVYANGSGSGVNSALTNNVRLDPSDFRNGIVNPGFAADVAHKHGGDSDVKSANDNSDGNKHNCFIKGFKWLNDLSQKTVSILIIVAILMVSLTVLGVVLLTKHSPNNPPINPGESNNEQENNAPIPPPIGYIIPDAIVKILSPKGFTVSIPDKDGIQLFAFHGSVNKKLNQKEAGQFSADVVNPINGFFTYVNDYAQFKCSDIIYFWTHVQIGTERLGYDRFNQQYNITAIDCLEVTVDVDSTGFNVSISAIEEWIKRFTFQGNINKSLHFPDKGEFGNTITKAELDNWTYEQKNFTLKCNDTLNYWVKVDFYKESGNEDIHKDLIYHMTDCGYKIPQALVEVLEPKGFRVSIPDKKGIQLFAFHGKINKKIEYREPGDFSRDINNPTNEKWVFEDKATKLAVGDVLYYWLYVIHSGEGFERDNQNFTVEDLKVNTTLSGVLRILNRLEWLAQPPAEPPTTLQTPVPYVIIQHTATEPCSSQAACIFQVRKIQTYHIESNHWNDIGYNFIVGGDGFAYEGRGWQTVGAHTYGYNTKSIGIAVIGTFNTVLPPKQQILALQQLIEKGVTLGYISKDYKIFGARQLGGTTESPGKTLYENMKTWPHWSASP